MDAAQEFEAEILRYQDPMNSVIDKFESPVQQFYCGAVVLVTGGSGFLGKQLVEKLFRASKVKRVYLLLRAKKGKSAKQRLDEILKDTVYEGLRKKQPDFADRITIVEGNVGELELGLSESDRRTVSQEVDIIFHMAATIRFDEPIKVSTLINVRGTREMIRLAKQCTRLRSFVYVSTAYSHATYSREGQPVLEQFYRCPVSPDTMIGLVETVADERLDDITPGLIKDWPNTYTFTKALAEEVVRTAGTELPVCVVRPAIVLHSHCEPMPGWLDLSCIFGPSAIILGGSLGVLHVLLVDKTKRAAFFPVDRTNNAILAAGWDAAARGRGTDDDATVYTVADEECFMTIDFVGEKLRNLRELSSNMAVWYCYLFMTNNIMFYKFLMWTLHYIPAYIMDLVCDLLNKKPEGISSFIKTLKLFDKQIFVFNYFLTQEWIFKNDNLKALFSRLSPEDRLIYNCNLNDIDYAEYVKIWAMGVRKYLLRDGLKDTDKGGKKQVYMKYLNILFLCLYVYAAWKLICLGVWGIQSVVDFAF